MKGSQIIFVFVFVICVASQRDPQPQVYPMNSVRSIGEKQYGSSVAIPVEPGRPPSISSSTITPRYPPPPPPPSPSPSPPTRRQAQPQSIISLGFSQRDNTFDPRDTSGRNDGRPSVIKSASQINDQQIDFKVEPQIVQDDNSNDLGNSAQFKGNNLQGVQTFDPLDYSINPNLITSFVCQSLKYFAFRTGTNNFASKNYLNPPKPCSNINFYFTIIAAQQQPYNNQLFRGYLMKNAWLFQSKVCPGYFIRVTPSYNMELTLGAYGSSMFVVHKFNYNHVVLRSNFYPSTFWRWWWGSIITSPAASKFMMQYWPQF